MSEWVGEQRTVALLRCCGLWAVADFLTIFHDILWWKSDLIYMRPEQKRSLCDATRLALSAHSLARSPSTVTHPLTAPLPQLVEHTQLPHTLTHSPTHPSLLHFFLFQEKSETTATPKQRTCSTHTHTPTHPHSHTPTHLHTLTHSCSP